MSRCPYVVGATLNWQLEDSVVQAEIIEIFEPFTLFICDSGPIPR